MKKIACVSLMLCALPNIGCANIYGFQDVRRVIGWIGSRPMNVDQNTKNIWNTHPYYNVVAIMVNKKIGTGELVSPKHILTNKHVAQGCGISGIPECIIYTSGGDTLQARVVLYGGDSPTEFNINDGNDWNILEITNKNFCSDHWTGYVNPTPVGGGMWRAGFGQLKVLSPQEFQTIRLAYYLAIQQDEKPDAPKVDFHNGLKVVSNAPKDSIMARFKKKYQELTGLNFMKTFLNDSYALKLVDKCSILEKTANKARHNCQSWPGDSGSAIQNSSNQIVLLHNSGVSTIGGYTPKSFGVPTERIFTTKVTDLLTAAKVSCESGVMISDDDNEPDIGAPCSKSHLPTHAKSGQYIQAGTKKYDCKNGVSCSCAATECDNGYYVVVDANGKSQGWCYTRKCPDGTHLNIIDGVKTDTQCVDNQ